MPGDRIARRLSEAHLDVWAGTEVLSTVGRGSGLFDWGWYRFSRVGFWVNQHDIPGNSVSS